MPKSIIHANWPITNVPESDAEYCCLIPSTSGIYAIDSNGNVWSRFKRGTGAVQYERWYAINGSQLRTRHCYVRLRRPHPHLTYIHHLVLEAFVGRRSVGMECRHLDGNAANNHWTNLRWGTRYENTMDAMCHGTAFFGQGDRHHQAKLSEEQVRAARKLYAKGLTIKEIATRFACHQATISSAVSGKSWRHIPNKQQMRRRLTDHRTLEEIANRLHRRECCKTICIELGVRPHIVYDVRRRQKRNGL